MTGGQTIMFSITVEADDEPKFASNAAIDNIDEEQTVVTRTVLTGVTSTRQRDADLQSQSDSFLVSFNITSQGSRRTKCEA